MGNFIAIYSKELRSYFVSPVAYVIAGVFLFLSGFLFRSILMQFNLICLQLSQRAQQMGGAMPALNLNEMVVTQFFAVMDFIWLLIVPMLTMRLFAEEKKKQQASKKKQHVVKVKEIRVRPRIDTHDLETKVNLGRKFIQDGCKLKVTLMYRGRELSRTDLGLAVLGRVREMFSDIAEVEKEGSLEGRRQTIVLTGK